MSKNTKVIAASVGVVIILISGVLMLRTPEKSKSPAPTPTITVSATPNPVAVTVVPSSTPNDTQNKVVQIIDLTTETVADEVPGLVKSLKGVWSWFTAFDAKHAVILLIVVFFLGSVFLGNRNKK